MPDAASSVDEAARRTFSERVLASVDPAHELLQALEALDARQDLATQAALFESVVWRVDTRHYWVFHRLSRVYAALGRADAGLLLAGFAAQMQPDWVPTFSPYQDLFRAFARAGRAECALDVFAQQMQHHPERPIAERHEIEPLLRALGLPAEAEARGAGRDRRDHPVIETGVRAPTPIAVLAGILPAALARLAEPMERPAIAVAEIAGGELLISRDVIVVCDADGVVQPDLSVCSYPALVHRRFLAAESAAPVERHEAGEAVVLLDAFPPPNLGHFLLDQVNRLELYRRAGADLGKALVVGPALRSAFQLEIAARAGIATILDTARVARLTAARLWVSTECRALRHPAHLGASWAIEHARAVLGGRGTVGRRRLYLSRADTAARRVVNEAELQGVLARHGFETIVPGLMPYREQIECFRTASHIVCVHGAALAHLVVCPASARVLEVFHPRYGTYAYAVVAHACGLDYTAMVARDGASDAPDLNDPALADPHSGMFGERDVRIDPVMLQAWLDRVA